MCTHWALGHPRKECLCSQALHNRSIILSRKPNPKPCPNLTHLGPRSPCGGALAPGVVWSAPLVLWVRRAFWLWLRDTRMRSATRSCSRTSSCNGPSVRLIH